MSRVDFRGCDISGATGTALEAFEGALAAFQSWRSGAETRLAVAMQDAPAFVMAHVLEAYLYACSRDPAQVRSARPVLARAARWRANARERQHLAAIAAIVADDYPRAKALLGELLGQHPRDVLALQVAHALDYVTGDTARMEDRVRSVLPAWSGDVPGFHAVLAMHAFGLEECGDYGRAEQVCRQALELAPFDARAHHVMAHVFETAARPDSGVAWLHEHVDHWAAGTVVATHCWWHLALFHLAQGDAGGALSLYDLRVRAGHSTALSDLIDAAALLWRIDMDGSGGDMRARWGELASAWAPHVADGFCTFNDIHAMIAFVGARDWRLARGLEDELVRRQALRTRHGATTRTIGLPACRALIAFGRGQFIRTIGQLARLPGLVHVIGGSHAQRDVLHLTLARAVERLRRPSRGPLVAA